MCAKAGHSLRCHHVCKCHLSAQGGRAGRSNQHEQPAAASNPGGGRHIIDSRTAGVELPLAAAFGGSQSSDNIFPSSRGLSGFTKGSAPPPEVALLHLR